MADILIEAWGSESSMQCRYCRTIEYLRRRIVGGTELPRSVETLLSEHYRGGFLFGNRACRQRGAWTDGTWQVSGRLTGSGQFTMAPDGPIVDQAIHAKIDGLDWSARRLSTFAARAVADSRLAGREWHVSLGETFGVTVMTKLGLAATISIHRFQLEQWTDEDIYATVRSHLSTIFCSEHEGKM